MKYLSIILSLFLSTSLCAIEKRPQTKKPPADKGVRPSQRPFPLHWGKPPQIQTRDLVPLPAGFGRGSSTLAKWISDNIKNDKENPIKPKPRPRPEPSPEIKAKIDELKAKRESMNAERKKLQDELKGKSKEDAVELIKAFREANKEKHQAIKEAHQELNKSVREKRQTGERRE